MREATVKVGHGSTAGAKLVASGVLATVAVPGYQNPRVSVATVEMLNALPSLSREGLSDQGGTLIVRCGGPQRAMGDSEDVDWETGRAFYGFHRSMTIRQAVNATAAWWVLAPKLLGVQRASMVPGAVLSSDVDRLWVTVGGLIVLDGTVDHFRVSYDEAGPGTIPLTGAHLVDPDDDMTGTWLPPTRSGNVALLARDW